MRFSAIYKYLFQGHFLIISVILLSTQAIRSENLYAEVQLMSENKAPAAQETVSIITPWEVKGRLDRFEPTIIVDVRSLQEYNTIHISGSMSFPLENIKTLVGVFPRDMAIVFY